MAEESTWIDFELWCNETSVCGYMNLDEADDEAPLNFYDRYGFECGTDVHGTKPISEPQNEVEWEIVLDWERILLFMGTGNLIQWLVDFADESTVKLFKGLYHGKVVTIELYINSSKLDNINKETEIKSTTIRIKQNTKKKLDLLGEKGMSYDDIINDLIKKVQ